MSQENSDYPIESSLSSSVSLGDGAKFVLMDRDPMGDSTINDPSTFSLHGPWPPLDYSEPDYDLPVDKPFRLDDLELDYWFHDEGSQPVDLEAKSVRIVLIGFDDEVTSAEAIQRLEQSGHVGCSVDRFCSFMRRQLVGFERGLIVCPWRSFISYVNDNGDQTRDLPYVNPQVSQSYPSWLPLDHTWPAGTKFAAVVPASK